MILINASLLSGVMVEGLLDAEDDEESWDDLEDDDIVH
jgi:hypothetical protein